VKHRDQEAELISVIVDTTATFVDVMMKSTRWTKLLTLCEDSKLQVVVPDVVLRETARHWEGQAIEAVDIANGKIGGIRKSRERLAELGLDGRELIDSPPVTITPNRAQFEHDQRDRLVSLGVDVPPIPNHVDVDTVLERDLARKRPFNGGKGFRDTLVWETAKQVVLKSAAGDKVFLVTSNTSDFCDESGGIAAELLSEVEGAAGELTRVANLDELLTNANLAPLVAGLAKTDEELAQFLALATAADDSEAESHPVGQVVRNAVIHAIEQLVGEEVDTLNAATGGHDFTELSIPGELEGLTIDTVEPDESTLSWQTYETYQDTTLLIQAEIQAEISLDGFAYKGDALHLEEEKRVYVLDWDWNDHMSHVSATTTARLTFQVRLEQGMNFVEECELESALPVLDYDDVHPWPTPGSATQPAGRRTLR
jgi:hypothetical protein